MITKLQVDKAISKILYSVIETGVCRIVTCQQPKMLSQVKSIYKKNLPLRHSLLWLPGNIDSIEQLALTLSEAGVPGIKPCFKRNELVQQIKAYLILCQQQGRLEIWIFENAELLTSEIYQLLGELVNSDYSSKTLFSFELWGGAQLDVNYHSGQLQACCYAQHYYIPVGKQILLAVKPKLPHRAVTLGLVVFLLGILLDNGYLYRSEINITDNTADLIAHDINGSFFEPTFEAIVDTTAKQTPEPITFDRAESTLEPFTETIQEQILKFTNKNTLTIAESGLKEMLNTDTVNSKHWFYSLPYSQLRDKYKIDLHDNIDRNNELYYLQLGVYKQQESLYKFFNLNVLSTQTYYFCYLEKNKTVALLIGSYLSIRQAYNAHDRLLGKGLISSVVTVNKYNQWQCSKN